MTNREGSTPRASASLRMVETCGSAWLRSMRTKVAGVIPALAARSTCVNAREIRNPFTFFPTYTTARIVPIAPPSVCVLPVVSLTPAREEIYLNLLKTIDKVYERCYDGGVGKKKSLGGSLATRPRDSRPKGANPMAEATIPKTRAQRGLALYRERGGEIVVYLDGTYGVPSRTVEGVIYHVDLEAGICECKDATKGGHTCLHSVAAEAKRAEIARKEAPGHRVRRRCSTLPPMAVRSRMARDFLARMGA